MLELADFAIREFTAERQPAYVDFVRGARGRDSRAELLFHEAVAKDKCALRAVANVLTDIVKESIALDVSARRAKNKCSHDFV
ncbi:hypothetical protein OH687_21665 [Burkholderia anthina]|nr:hypothetical protein OH687_21665 [Burkholderia anthina]